MTPETQMMLMWIAWVVLPMMVEGIQKICKKFKVCEKIDSKVVILFIAIVGWILYTIRNSVVWEPFKAEVIAFALSVLWTATVIYNFIIKFFKPKNNEKVWWKK